MIDNPPDFSMSGFRWSHLDSYVDASYEGSWGRTLYYFFNLSASQKLFLRKVKEKTFVWFIKWFFKDGSLIIYSILQSKIWKSVSLALGLQNQILEFKKTPWISIPHHFQVWECTQRHRVTKVFVLELALHLMVLVLCSHCWIEIQVLSLDLIN